MQAPRAKPVRSSTASTPELEEAKDLYNDIHIYFDHLHDVFNDFADEEGHLPPTAEQFLNDYKAYLSSSSAYQPTTNIPSRPWRKSFPPYFPPAFFQSIHMKNPSTFTPVPARVEIERVRVSACLVNSITNDDGSSSPAVKLLQQSLNAMKSIEVSSNNKRKLFSAFFDLFLYLSTTTQTTTTKEETKKLENTTTTTTTTTTITTPTLPITPESNKRNSFWNVFDPFFYFTSKPEAKSSIVINTSSDVPVIEPNQKVEGQASTLNVEPAQETKPTIESTQEIKPAELKVEPTQDISSTELKVEPVQETKPAELKLVQETKPAELSAESTQETKPVPEIDLAHKVTINPLVPAVQHNVVETSTIDASKVKLTEKDVIEAPTLDVPAIQAPRASKTSYIKGRQIQRVKPTKSLSTCKEEKEMPKLESFPTPMFGGRLELVSQLISFTKSRSIKLNFASMRMNLQV